jgi:transcriptional regulator with XRE-family HTH domain
MANLNPAKVIRRVRKHLELSQEGLSRLLNATKGAVQHWERGRNNPDLARLLALRQLCSPGPERRELDALVRQTQAEVAPFPASRQILAAKGFGRGARGAPTFPSRGLTLLRRENHRLQRQVGKLEATLQRRSEQLRILEDLAADLQRQMAKLRAGQPEKEEQARTGSSA